MGALVGVLSERDCARRLVLAGKPPERLRSPTSWSARSSRVDPAQTFADCLKLMHQHGIRHLPVVDGGKSHRGRLDPRPAERGGRPSRQDHRRTRARAADHFHVDGLSGTLRSAWSDNRTGAIVMNLLIVLGALVFLMFVAYRGYSVILFAPVAALRRRVADRPVAGRRRCSPAFSWRRWSAS